MISFRRLESVFKLKEIIHRYKMIYQFRGTYCILNTNHKDHVDWANAYFRYVYHRESDARNLIKIDSKQLFNINSLVSNELYQQLSQYIQYYMPQQLNSVYEGEMDNIDCNDGSIVFYKQKRIIIISDQSFRQIYIIADPSSDEVKYEPARMIREIMSRYMERQGFFLLHASAVEKDGQAVLFCGNKGVGKTTIMLGLLARGYNLIGNDKVYVGIENRQVKLYSWPGPIGITTTSMTHFPQLQSAFQQLPKLMFPQKRLHPDEQLLAELGLEEQECSKLDLSIEETVSLFRRQLVREAVLHDLIVIGDYPSKVDFKPIQQQASILHILKHHFFYPRDDSDYPASDPSYPYWYGINNQGKRWMLLFETTVSIIARLIKVRTLSNVKIDPVQRKIEKIDQQLQKLRDSSK